MDHMLSHYSVKIGLKLSPSLQTHIKNFVALIKRAAIEAEFKAAPRMLGIRQRIER